MGGGLYRKIKCGEYWRGIVEGGKIKFGAIFYENRGFFSMPRMRMLWYDFTKWRSHRKHETNNLGLW